MSSPGEQATLAGKRDRIITLIELPRPFLLLPDQIYSFISEKNYEIKHTKFYELYNKIVMLPLRSRVASLQKSAKEQNTIEKVTHKPHPWNIATIMFGLSTSSIPNRFK